jgi:hypothetical protein
MEENCCQQHDANNRERNISGSGGRAKGSSPHMKESRDQISAMAASARTLHSKGGSAEDAHTSKAAHGARTTAAALRARADGEGAA